MRRDAFAKAGLYDEETPNGYAEDYDWVLRRRGPAGRDGDEPAGGHPRRTPSRRTTVSGTTVAGLEYMLAKHPESPRRRRGRARLLGQIGFARSVLGERSRPALRGNGDHAQAGVTARISRSLMS